MDDHGAIFVRDLNADARMYFRAPRSAIELAWTQFREKWSGGGANAVHAFIADTEPMSSHEGVAAGNASSEHDWLALLPPVRFNRYLGYKRLAQTRGASFYMAGMLQNPAFWKRV